MKELSVGFVGGGRVVGILLEGWKRAQKMPASIIVSDCNSDSLDKLKGRFPLVQTVAGKPGLAAEQDIVFLAVHPPVMAEVATGLRGTVGADSTVVSLAPKFAIAKPVSEN